MSLAELEAFVATSYPLLHHRPALMRAYKLTTSREGGGDGDHFVVRVCVHGYLVTGAIIVLTLASSRVAGQV